MRRAIGSEIMARQEFPLHVDILDVSRDEVLGTSSNLSAQ